MRRNIGFIALAICFILVTFLGLGPAMFAHQSVKDRILMISLVLVLYALIAGCFELLRRRNNRVK